MTSRTVEKNIETALEDARWNLKLAKEAQRQGAPHRITISICIHSIIRATDCLCWLYNGERCDTGRSHSLHRTFKNLYSQKDLPEKHSKYTSTIKKWVTEEKVKAEYKGEKYSRKDSDRVLKQSERYLKNCVEDLLQNKEIL